MSAPTVDSDLSWLFQDAAGQVSGLGSQLSGLVSLAQTGACRAAAGTGGIPRSIQGITEGQYSAVGRERRLLARLRLVLPAHRDVLYLAYGPQEWGLHAGERRSFGRWPGVVLLTRAGQKLFLKARAARFLVSEKKTGEVAERLLGELVLFERRGIGEALRSTKLETKELETLREEAAALVTEAHKAWVATGPIVLKKPCKAYRSESAVAPLRATYARKMGS